MALPKQAQAQLEQAEELERQLTEGTFSGQPPEEPSEHVEPPPVTPVTSTPEVDDDPVWEQRYRSLQGMYRADQERAQQQIADLTRRLTELERAPPPPSEALRQESLVTQEDVETFGQDLIDLQRKVAQEIAAGFQAELDAVRTENAALLEALNHNSSRVGALSFDQELRSLVPDFEAVNADPLWVKWLDTVDDFLGAPRRVLAQTAFEQGDAKAVARYVNLFRGAAPEDRRQAELRRQVQPGRSTGSTTAQPAKARYTDADIRQLFTEMRNLNSQNRYDEAAKIDAEISAAYLDGRVTG